VRCRCCADGLGYADDGEEHFSSGGESGGDDDDADDGEGGDDAAEVSAAADQPGRRKRKRGAGTSGSTIAFQPLGATLSLSTTAAVSKASKQAVISGEDNAWNVDVDHVILISTFYSSDRLNVQPLLISTTFSMAFLPELKTMRLQPQPTTQLLPARQSQCLQASGSIRSRAPGVTLPRPMILMPQ
jgi:hypothetical protein